MHVLLVFNTTFNDIYATSWPSEVFFLEEYPVTTIDLKTLTKPYYIRFYRVHLAMSEIRSEKFLEIYYCNNFPSIYIWIALLSLLLEIKSFWIGLRTERWVTGETFLNLFSVDHQLNYYDSKYPDDSDNSCGMLFIGSQIAIQDESCNIRKRNYFMCEIFKQHY